MKACPQRTAAALEAVVSRMGKVPLGVRLEAPPSGIRERSGVLATPQGGHTRLLELEVDREVVPPGVLETMARQLLADRERKKEIDAAHAQVETAFADLACLLPSTPFVALHGDDTSSPFLFSLFAETLGHSLDRRWTRVWRIGAQHATSIATRMAGEERARQERVRTHGGRRQALLSCPVAARAIEADPDKWRTRLAQDLNGGTAGLPFKDGTYRPMLFLGGVRWREATLMVEREYPETLRLAMVGRPLSDIVSHPHIPSGITITGTAQRRGDGQIYIRTDAKPQPLAPLLDRLGLQV